MPLLTAADSTVLVIDLQEKLLTAIHEHDALLGRVVRFVQGAKACHVPVVATEHWPDKIGATHPELVPHLDTIIGKTHFDAAREEAVLNALPPERKRVLVVGAEAHICVLQTALTLASKGFQPVLVVDGIGSRLDSSRQAALQRWQQHGFEAVTMEMALFEWLETPANPVFKAILPLVK